MTTTVEENLKKNIEENKDKIYMIKLFKKLNIWNNKFNEGETIYNNNFLNELGYICDRELCSELILVYVNENKNKMIIYFDGINSEISNILDNYKYIEFFKYIDKYTLKVKNIVTKINQKYDNYKKLYLGYCLGGYMVNNFVQGKNIIGYTYNSFGIKINNESNLNITNYCELLDYINIFWRNNSNTKMINSHDEYFRDFILNNFFNISNLFNYSNLAKFRNYVHSIYNIDAKSIEIEF